MDFSGGGYRPGSTVTITDNDVFVATVTADAAGNFTVQLCLTDLGRHRLAAIGESVLGGQLINDATVEVLAAVRARGNIPRTGSDIVPAVALGVGLVAVGVMLVFVRRRRPSAS
ncbi:MAG TPA: LPXTG cell wall anchor domain-containing protein [Mycobacteriales bacterium]|nr:LPXTG cell wall anchor domain-containing protein [Mycobacteriales bacterium]